MKRKVKFIAMVMSVFLMFGTLAGCVQQNGQQDGGLNNGGGVNNTEVTSSQSENHYAKVTQRNDYIVKNSQAYYTVVIPENAETYEKKAADLVVEYFKKATGATLQIVTDANITNTNGKYISFGNTKLFQNSGVSIPEKDFGSSGFRIVTKGNVVYIAGANTTMRRGTYYGAQEFLKHTLDWEAYTSIDIRYTQTNEVKMYDFEVREIPDFDFRRTSFDINTFSNDYANILRMTPRNEEDELGLSGHSHFEILDPKVYYQEHPDWFYSAEEVTGDNFDWWRKGQLCLSNEEMTQEFINRVVQLFIQHPKAEFIHIGHMDSMNFCNCKNCTNWKTERDTNNAGLMVGFTNKVARGVCEIMKDIDPNRNFTFELFAYLRTIQPPTHTEFGKIVADHPDVIPDDNVMIQFTPIQSSPAYTLDDDINKKYYEYFKGWSAISDNISVWKYAINFTYFMVHLKNWDVVTEDLKMYKEGGVKRMYDQGPMEYNVAQMKEMRVWIYGKLLWNSGLSWDDLAHEFISQYYGPTSEEVQSYYDYMTTYCEKITANDGYAAGDCYVDITQKKFWSYAYVEGGKRIFMRAYDKLKAYKDENPEEYEKYYWRLSSVYFENMFMQLELYMSEYSYAENKATLNLFKQTRMALGIEYYMENTSKRYTEYEQKWEVALNAMQ